MCCTFRLNFQNDLETASDCDATTVLKLYSQKHHRPILPRYCMLSLVVEIYLISFCQPDLCYYIAVIFEAEYYFALLLVITADGW